MATWPPPAVPSFPAGYQPQQADFLGWWQQTAAFLQNRVVFRARQTVTAATLPSSGAATPVVFDTIDEDPYNGFNGTVQVVTTLTGSGTFSFPPGVSTCMAECWAGGSGGGAGNGTGGGGGGGGGGEYAAEPSLAVGATSAYTAGSAGGSSTFAGSSVTVTAHAGTAGGAASGSAPGAAGSGGTGSTNTTRFSGARGGAGGQGGGGGGSSGGTSAAGNHGFTGGPSSGGAGGTAPAGGGSGGGGGGPSSGNGQGGGTPGGGAGGAGIFTAAGNGTAGLIRVTYSTTGTWVAPYSGWYQVTMTIRIVNNGALVDLRPMLAGTYAYTLGLSQTANISSSTAGASGTYRVYLVGGQDTVGAQAQLLNAPGNGTTALTAGQESSLEIVWLGAQP